ncbi:MAG: phage major capsid protein [Planctomycetota bacterium]
MPELTKTKITAEDLAVEHLLGVTGKSVDEWKKNAKKLVRAKMLQVVDADGNEIDATLVINAVAPTAEELADEGEDIEEKMDGEEDDDAVAKALNAEAVNKIVKGMLAESRRETDARIKIFSSTTTRPRNDDKAKCGFKHFGDYALAIKNWATTQTLDERLQAPQIMKGPDYMSTKAPTTFGSAGIGADGGFLIPDEFRATINEHVFGDQALLPLTDNVTVSGNTLVVPRDETSPWGGDGVQVYWVGETGTLTQSKPKLGENSIKLHKLAALVPMTEELLSDSAVGVESYLNSKVGPKIDFAVSDAIVNGDGNGKPVGIVNSGALSTIAKEVSQTADTVVTQNVLKMVEGLHTQNDSSVRWLHHRTCFSQLASLTLGDQPMFIPAGRISDKPGGNLLGYDLLKHQACQIVGDLNDLILVDFSSYQTVTKAEGVRQDMSIHLYFDSDDLAFRYVFRVGGQSKFTGAIDDNNGSGTSSPFVNLAART